ncbi:MAG: cytochrome-c peroxidase [Bacteroidia bacterium]
MRYLAMICLAACALVACDSTPEVFEQAQPTLPGTPYTYAPVISEETGVSENLREAASRIDDDAATLGRVLFYDKKLSVNNRIACAGCHFQDQAFSDGKAVSPGFARALTNRNAMSIINPLTQTSFFWDGRTKDLKDMVLAPVQNHIEMGLEDMAELEVKLNAVGYYPELFAKAYGDQEITRQRVSGALTEFLKSMTSYQSAYDEGVESNFANFTEVEKRGKDLFFGIAGCSQCHNGPDLRQWMPPWGSQWEETWANVGLESTPVDEGAGSHTADQIGVFRAPSLRNVALTGPYMHDGRFANLQDVVNHYNEGVVASEHLDWRLAEPNFTDEPAAKRLGLSQNDQTALIAFLETLTDKQLIQDEKFSDPF